LWAKTERNKQIFRDGKLRITTLNIHPYGQIANYKG